MLTEAQFRVYRSYVAIMTDQTQRDENKLQAAQEINDNLELIMSSQYVQSFLELMLRAFTKIVIEGQPQYISEHGVHKIRKIIFEIIYRIPHNEHLRVYIDPLMTLCIKVLVADNEDVVLVCMRIIVELLKNYKPGYQNIILMFMQFAKTSFNELSRKINEIFLRRPTIWVNDLQEIDMDSVLSTIYYASTIEVSRGYNPEGKQIVVQYTLLPKACNSLKALQEIPTVVILIYQLYRENMKQELAEFIPIIIASLCLKPPAAVRADKSFSKEIFVEFMSAQVKVLSFIAYIIRIQPDLVMKYTDPLVEGIFNCLTMCPKEVTSLRRDLLVGIRYILNSDMRLYFLDNIDKLFDEEILLKNGFTTNETLRPLMYSTLADYVHHVRQHISISTIVKAVKMFSIIVHDESLPTSVQTMAAKLLLNLVEFIKNRQDINNTNELSIGKLLMKVTKIFVLKIKVIVNVHIPFLKNKAKAIQSEQQAAANTEKTDKTDDAKDSAEITGKKEKQEIQKMKYGHPIGCPVNYLLADTKALFKTLICGIKMAALAYTLKMDEQSSRIIHILTEELGGDKEQHKRVVFTPVETNLYMRMVKYSCIAFDLYSMPVTLAAANNMRAAKLRSKEDFDVFDYFNSTFTSMHPHTFKEIFSVTIGHFVDRMAYNSLLFTINEAFLLNKDMSVIYGTILLKYLVSKMKDMGNDDQEKSGLYLKLFKTVFESVTTRNVDSENMLRPYLAEIVNKSMEYALTAKEPVNYFFLLRGLFRSIGGGSHDLLYQEFLPLLPTLLQNLNSLQSGCNKQQTKDLFVELCLTVPVRLSSLLPYLPMLMDPLVSAFNGSPHLIGQGLRTLELCVDNLQPDFFYDHIQPIRSDLMQALWRSLHNYTDQVAHVAFRVLGKLGGGNRKMIQEPQCLKYTVDRLDNPEILIHFPGYSEPINLGVKRAIETAVTALKSPNTDSFYRLQCWEVIKGFLLSSIDINNEGLNKFFLHNSFTQADILEIHTDNLYKFSKTVTRNTHLTALTGMFIAILVKELAKFVIPTMVAIVSHYTMVAIAQQAGPFAIIGNNELLEGTMDPLVLIDAIAVIMGYEEKELCKPGRIALSVILNTATAILGSKERACKLPLMEYMVEKLCALCFERPWYAKLGGCMAIQFLCTRMEIYWVFRHVPTFVKAQLFVMMDLYGEVSNGAVDQARLNLREMIKSVAQPMDFAKPDLITIQKNCIFEITYDLTRQITSPNEYVRKEAVDLLKLVAETQGKHVTKIIECHKNILVDMIPPKKHLLRHQPMNAQIGLMEGTTFCTSLNPRLFSIDLTIHEHNMFFHEVCNICETSDANLMKLACYKSVTNFTALRKAAMRVLSTCHYISTLTLKIFNYLYQCLERGNNELQETAFECLKQFLAGAKVDVNTVHGLVRPLLGTLADYRNITVFGAQKLCYVVQLFPSCFKEKLCEQLLTHMKHFFDNLRSIHKAAIKSDTKDVERIIIIMMDVIYHSPAVRPKLTEILMAMVIQYEMNLNIGCNSPFREPLLKFLTRYPFEAISLIIQERYFKEYEFSKFLLYLLKHETGQVFRDVFEKVEITDKLLELHELHKQPNHNIPLDDRIYIRYNVIQIMAVLTKYNIQWLAVQKRLVTNLMHIWTNDAYLERWPDITSVPHITWNEPKLVVKVLLQYFSVHPIRFDLLFYLMNAFSVRMVSDFQFLKDFLENTVCNYSTDWKRQAFLRYCELCHTPNFSENLKINILQYIIIPCFTISFKAGDVDKLITGPENQLGDGNLVTLFITKLIDNAKRNGCSDTIKILFQQFAILIVEYACHHLSGNKAEDSKLRILMEFVWPCLNNNNKKCNDSMVEYHGHLLLCHIISKMAINKKIVLQVFRGLLKASNVEVRNIVKQGLDILTPVLPTKIDDGYKMLAHWTKKIIIEDGHCAAQLVHVLSFVVRQYKVYYPIRHRLVHYLVSSMTKLTAHNTGSNDYRKLSVDISEVIIKWELMRIRDDAEGEDDVIKEGLKRIIEGSSPPGRKKQVSEGCVSSVSSSSLLGITKEEIQQPIDKQHIDNILNYLIKLPCMINDFSQSTLIPHELLARRSINVIKTALKPDIWPHINANLRVAWMDKHLCMTTNTVANVNSVCVGLEILAILIVPIKKEEILTLCSLIKNGLLACISSTNPKIIRYTYHFLSRLMGIFPPEPPTSTAISNYEELNFIYGYLVKVIFEGLSTYEKAVNANGLSVYCPIMLINAGCVSNPEFVDRFCGNLVRVIQRLVKEYGSVTGYENINAKDLGITAHCGYVTTGGSDILLLALDLLKNRVAVMKPDVRKVYLGIIISLIESTSDAKIMKAICKLLEDWTSPNKSTNYCGPSIPEKSVLLIKTMHHIEKGFPELHCLFLEIIYNIYKEEIPKPTELVSKLEVAFLTGLRCRNPHLRAKFFDLLDGWVQRRLIYRLLYIVSSQNWEGMSSHYWLKQCLEFLLVTAESDGRMILNKNEGIVPSITSVIKTGNMEEQRAYNTFFENKSEELTSGPTEDDADIDIYETTISTNESESQLPSGDNTLHNMIKRQQRFLTSATEYKVLYFLKALCQLCHANTALAEETWLHIFPQIWNILPDRERTDLMGEIPPFIASGSHVVQKDAHPSAVSTFYEGLALCSNPVIIKPHVMVYMAKNHNLWHRVALTLEKMAIDNNVNLDRQPSGADCYEFVDPENIPQQEIIDSLAELYDAMSEEDLMCGLWQKYAKFTETIMALTFEQQGCFEQALGAYELVVGKARQTYATTPSPVHLASEQRLWEKHWIRCTKELNQWDHLLDYAQTVGHSNPALILDSAWRVQDWDLMKQALAQVDVVYPGSLSWKVDLYKGYLAICHPEEKQLHVVERLVEQASIHCIKEWRKLPYIVSAPHIKLLQAAQQIIELQEAFMIHDSLLAEKGNTLPGSVHDMKAIVKTWRNRLPVIGDDLSHWSDIFTWRQHHYQFITSHFDDNDPQTTSSHSILGVHASAQAIIHFGKIARKHNLCTVSLDSLTRLYTIPTVPIVDCFQKILQQVKCYQQMSVQNGRNELQEAIDAIEYTNMRYLTKEMTAEFYALKGMLLSQIGNLEDADKSFSAALQLHDTLVKGWALWGDFMESQFVKNSPPDKADIRIGISAVLCFLNACKHQNESKARKYLAKIIWLITYDDSKCTLTEVIEKHSGGIPSTHWLPWIPQLLTCLAREEGKYIINLISQVGRLYPQAIYFPTRTMYFTHKIEQRERFKSTTSTATDKTIVKRENGNSANTENANTGGSATSQTSSTNLSTAQVKASPTMLRCSKIMQMQREAHPTILLSLEGIVDQMVWFREHWSEEVLRQLRLGLAKSYALAFENRGAVIEANISMSTHNFLRKLVSTFGTGLEIYSSSLNTPFSNAGSESLARRTQITMSDPVFQKMKQQFTEDFDFNIPGAKKLHNFIAKLRKWIRILEKKVSSLPKSFRIEEKCRFLSNFSAQTAEIELPGEFLLPKHSHYYVRIARFVPRIEVVEKHNMATRRLYIRGHNGKTYAYLIMQESAMADARREETVLQLMRMLNHYLTKQKETSRRGLTFTIPRVVAVSPQLRLVEDNPSSISLLDIYRLVCKKRDVQYDEPLIKYYERLALVQAKGKQTNMQVLKDILKEIQCKNIPPFLFKKWATETYRSPVDYWMLRKTLTMQISLSCFVEYVFHLTRLNPDMMYIHQDSGLLNISYFKFDVDDAKGEVDANRAVPFRLTPNLTDFISEVGVRGPLIASMIATARCFSYRNFQLPAILKALLRDEMMASYKRKSEEDISPDNTNESPTDVPGEVIIIMVTRSVNSIVQRLSSLTNFDGLESKVDTLVSAARNVDNLCRMDPTWHPWL